MKQLGDILLEKGLIEEAQLAAAFDEHQRAGRPLGRVLVDLGVLTESQLVAALAAQIGLEFVDLTEHPVDPGATTLLPDTLARRYRAIAIGERDGKLLVAMSDPANVYALDDIRAITNRDVQPVVATAADVEQAIQKFAGLDSQVEALAAEVQEVTGNTVELAYVDQGYTGDDPATAAEAHGIELRVVSLPEAKKGFVLLPRRRVIERSFAWAARFRRLAKDYERLPGTVVGLHFVAFACLLLHRALVASGASP